MFVWFLLGGIFSYIVYFSSIMSQGQKVRHTCVQRGHGRATRAELSVDNEAVG